MKNGYVAPNSSTQLTFLIFFNSDSVSENILNEQILQTYAKFILNGNKTAGASSSFNYLIEKIGSNVPLNDGTITKEIISTGQNLVPSISPITLVENYSEITGNATKALQFTIIQQNNYAFNYSLLMNFIINFQYSNLLTIKKLTPTSKKGASAPEGNIDYIGQVYFDGTNKKWYVAESLTTWREASTN